MVVWFSVMQVLGLKIEALMLSTIQKIKPYKHQMKSHVLEKHVDSSKDYILGAYVLWVEILVMRKSRGEDAAARDASFSLLKIDARV